MARSSHPAIIVVNVCLLPLGLVVLIAGLVGLVSMTEMWWAFALLAVGGAVVFGGAVHEIAAWGRAADADQATAQRMLAAARGGAAIAPPGAGARHGTGPVLAHWTYAPAEWRAYADAELRHRTREALGMAATVIAVGTPLIGLMEGEWRTALIISGATGGAIGIGRWLVGWLAHRRDRAVDRGEVIVGPDAVLVNGRYESLHDRRVGFSRAYVREGARGPLLVVSITVPGRYRRMPDEYRFPVPAGREAEARGVAEGLNRAHAALPAAAAASLPGG